jgi:hypothetical protein
MSWNTWQNLVIEDWAELTLPIAQESAWKDFARAFISRLGISKYVLPSPENYTDWKQWATQLQTALNGGLL